MRTTDRSNRKLAEVLVLRTRRPLLLACAILFPIASVGQAQSLAGFGETIEVRRIDVDVVVTDEAGNPVSGLGREEFVLLEDGKPVELREFSEFRGDRLPSVDGAEVASGDSGASSVEGVRSPITWVIYMDSVKPAPGPRNDAMKQVQQFLAESAMPDDRFVMATSDGRELRLNADIGSDRAALERAFAEAIRIAGAGVGRRASAGQILLLVNDVAAAVPGDGARRPVTDDSEAFWSQLDAFLAEEDLLARNALRNLDDLFGIVSGIPGRSAVLLVGGNLELRPGVAMMDRLRARVERIPGALTRLIQVSSRQRDLRSDYQRLIERANASRITLFTIDAANGDDFGRSAIEENGLGAAVPARMTNPELATGLGELAHATGGRPFQASPKLRERLAVAASDLTSYYSLSYEPRQDVDAGYRRIEVRVARPGLRVRHREGIRERPVDEKSNDMAVAALLGGVPPNPLALRADWEAAAPGKKATTHALRIEVPIGRLLLVPDATALRGKLSFHFAMVDEHESYHRLESREFEISLPQQELARSLDRHLSYIFDVPIRKGSWRVAAVVTDTVGGQESTIVLPLEVVGGR